jgi:hypothetical protein
MDSILKPLLDSKNETERDRLFDELIRMKTAPLVRKLIRQRLGFYLNPDGSNPRHPEAEDLYLKILLGLRQRINLMLAEPEKSRINDYEQCVVNVAGAECRKLLVARSGPRARLERNLRELFNSGGEFKVWTDNEGSTLCGFASWEGRRISIASAERLARMAENLESFKPARGSYKSLQKAPNSKLAGEILQWLGDPVEYEALVDLVAAFRGISDQPAEAIEAALSSGEIQDAFQTPNAGEDPEKKKIKLTELWEEINKLPKESRLALCFSPAGGEADDLCDLLLASNVASPAELAEGLEIPLETLMRIWRRAPMDNETLGDCVGATALQVSRWRFQAVNYLRERYG